MNVSSLIPSNLLSTLDKTGLPTAFGDQIKQKKTVISSLINQLQTLEKQLEEIIKEKLDLEISHSNNIKKIYFQYTSNKIDEKEYNILTLSENDKYKLEINVLEEQQKVINEQISSITKDPKTDLNLKNKKYKNIFKQSAAKNKINVAKSGKILFASTTKQLVPLLMYGGIKSITKISIQNNKLRKLVEKTNKIIEEAITPEQMDLARATRNSAYNILTNTENELIKIKKTLETITIILTILSTLSTVILAAISVPGVPASAYKPYDEIVKKINFINSILLILLGLLNFIIYELDELRNLLKNIDNKLDMEIIKINSLDDLISFVDSLRKVNEETYKGFRLVIKEDNNPNTFVKDSIKRHYAVALDRDGVEIYKSEYSYTLEPKTLIEQLKIIIDSNTK